MSELEKKNDKEYMICLMPKASQTFFVYSIQSKKKKKLLKKNFLTKRGNGGLNKKTK